MVDDDDRQQLLEDRADEHSQRFEDARSGLKRERDRLEQLRAGLEAARTELVLSGEELERDRAWGDLF